MLNIVAAQSQTKKTLQRQNVEKSRGHFLEVENLKDEEGKLKRKHLKM